MRYSNFTLAGVAEFSVSDGNLNGDSQPPIRALREPAVLKLRSPAKGVETNANAIAHLYGPETDAWTGKRISLFSTEVDFAGKMTLALRVRLKAPKAEANGNPAAKLWQRWNELVTEAGQFKVKVPALDAAASEADIISAGKALAQAIAEAKAF